MAIVAASAGSAAVVDKLWLEVARPHAPQECEALRPSACALASGDGGGVAHRAHGCADLGEECQSPIPVADPCTRAHPNI
mmetsp:Transcript_63873/g.140667  ORF Transcript_63873/g.140667 Transcript_63873/m.140667 type:complete len:80 (-) Transcript_63873:64-303(-)